MSIIYILTEREYQLASNDIISYSQAGQDVFVRAMTNFATSGYFIDIGCQYPKCLNNTYMLETMGWNGILIDKDPKVIAQCKEQRIVTSLEIDLTTKPLIDIFRENNVPKVIDYISFDIDWDTEKVLMSFPFDEYAFRIMTFEHDFYTGGPVLREKSRSILQNQGYKIICGDVQNQGNSFEDWYINPNLISSNISYHSHKNYEEILSDFNIIKRID